MRVDFPAPLSPIRAVTWPAGTSRSTPLRASTAPKRLTTLLTDSSGVPSAAGHRAIGPVRGPARVGGPGRLAVSRAHSG